MTTHSHAVVWIDHREARIFHFNRDDVEKLVLHPNDPAIHIHNKTNSIGTEHAPEDQDFLRRVAAALKDTTFILFTGPASAKTELFKHIHSHEPLMMDKIAGVETVDHPSDKALIAHARDYFKADHQKLQRAM